MLVIYLTDNMGDKVQKWLSDLGVFRQKTQDDNTNFHFVINYPENNVMDVIQPKINSDLLVIGCATNVSAEHLAEMRNLSSKKRKEFIWDLKFMINSQNVDFQLQHPNNILENFVITTEIFEDGLSKDRLISSLKSVYRAKIMCVWKIQREFGYDEEEKDTSSDAMYV